MYNFSRHPVFFYSISSLITSSIDRLLRLVDSGVADYARAVEVATAARWSVRKQCTKTHKLFDMVMITSPLPNQCLLPNNSVVNSSVVEFFESLLFNQQCFLTVKQTVTPYVGFWNSFLVLHQSTVPLQIMETRYF